jgi:hypothetical protein
MLQNLRGLRKFLENSDSDIHLAKTPRAPSDRPKPFIPSECEGSKGKDFSLCSKQGFLPSVEMTIVFLCGLCVFARDIPTFGCGFAALGYS